MFSQRWCNGGAVEQTSVPYVDGSQKECPDGDGNREEGLKALKFSDLTVKCFAFFPFLYRANLKGLINNRKDQLICFRTGVLKF